MRLPLPPLLSSALALVALSCASPATASDLSDFERARSIYMSGDYPRAVQAFRDLVGTEPPRLTDPLLILESRKYLAASLVFVDREAEAREQFRKLLRQEEDYALDPLAFPRAVVRLFQRVRAEVQAEIDARRAAEAESKAKAERRRRAAARRRRESLLRLRELASQRRVETRRLRWIALLPFGVGQFQNDDKGLGVSIAVAEGLFAAGSVGTFLAHQSLTSETPDPSQVEEANRLERTLRLANWVSFGAFLAIAVAGAIDAQVRFKGVTVERTPRPLPRDLDRWVDRQLRAGAPLRWVW